MKLFNKLLGYRHYSTTYVGDEDTAHLAAAGIWRGTFGAGQYYDATKIDTPKGERWFCAEAEAVVVGWRRAKL
jgi:hypothetical protein